MLFAETARFPRCNQYLRTSLPKVAEVPRLAAAMREIGALDRAAFVAALKPGTPPVLETTKLLGSLMPGTEPFIVPKDKSNRILVARALFEAFEIGGGDKLLGQANVSVPGGTPGAREFSGRFDGRGMLAQLSGSPPRPGSGMHSLGHYREKDVFLLGVAVLGALAVWGNWTKRGIHDPFASVHFAAHAYRSIMF